MRRLSLISLPVLALGLTACEPAVSPSSETTASATVSGFVQSESQQSVSGAEIARRVERLASDEFAGRPPSGPGALESTQYIADEMASAGMVPMGENGTYFQNVTLTEVTSKDSSFARITASDKSIELNQGDNSVFWTKRYAKSTKVTDSELVFVGYGTVAPEYDWNDYAGLDVAGKTVVMLVNDPGFATKDEDLFKGETMTYYGRWTYKYEEAARQGAAGVIVIHETAPASYPWDVVSGSWTGAQFDLVRPDKGMSNAALEGWVTREQAVDLFKASGLDFEAQKAKAATREFAAVPMNGLTLSAQIDNDIKETQSRNVAGGVIGSKFPDEFVLYMGHWDHLGAKETAEGEDGIYNGAVDNATGTAAIIEIGQTFANGPQPERSIIAVAVTAEESGLLGSAYYGEQPLVPLAKTVAGINIDAILPVGDTKDIIVVGFGASQIEDRLKAILDTKGKYIVPDQNPSAGYFYRSDHISLAKKGVPMLYADSGIDHVTKGKDYGKTFSEIYTKDRYHKPADEYSADWDMSGIEATTQIFFELGTNIANTQEWPNWYEGNEFRALRDDMLK